MEIDIDGSNPLKLPVNRVDIDNDEDVSGISISNSRQSITGGMKMYEGGYNTAVSPANELGLLTGFLVVFIYLGFCLYKIAQNCGEKESAWWAFVPIVQVFLMLKVARKPLWWFLLFLVPIVNIIFLAITWVHIAQNCGASGVWGVLAVIPILNLFAWGKLALTKPQHSFFTQPSEVNRPRTPQNVG